MASPPQFTDNQDSFRRAQAAAVALSDIQNRSIATPERHEPRRVGLNGRAVSEKASGIIGNEAHCRKAQLPTGQVSPEECLMRSIILNLGPRALNLP